MRTLYVSDLDGTLLQSNAKTSEYTNQVINQLTSKGILFSYATARSYLTAAKATKGLNAPIPIITYNGEDFNMNIEIYPLDKVLIDGISTTSQETTGGCHA